LGGDGVAWPTRATPFSAIASPRRTGLTLLPRIVKLAADIPHLSAAIILDLAIQHALLRCVILIID
jgi:hypothetical protein